MTDINSAVALAKEYADLGEKFFKAEEEMTEVMREMVRNRNLPEKVRQENAFHLGQVLNWQLFRRLVGPDFGMEPWWFAK